MRPDRGRVVIGPSRDPIPHLPRIHPDNPLERSSPPMSEANPTAAPAAPAATRHAPDRPIISKQDQDYGATENALLLGIDLGTSRSSIVSMNGARKTVESY